MNLGADLNLFECGRSRGISERTSSKCNYTWMFSSQVLCDKRGTSTPPKQPAQWWTEGSEMPHREGVVWTLKRGLAWGSEVPQKEGVGGRGLAWDSDVPNKEVVVGSRLG